MTSESEDALRTDAYLEALLAAHGRAPVMPPRAVGASHAGAVLLGGRRSAEQRAATIDDEVVAPDVRSAAAILERRLVRFHPSFRFEEALAARLRTAARRQSLTASGSVTEPPPARPAESDIAVVAFPDAGAPARDTDPLAWTSDARPRTLIVGGAIASGVSLAGAALFAWRRGGRLPLPFTGRRSGAAIGTPVDAGAAPRAARRIRLPSRTASFRGRVA